MNGRSTTAWVQISILVAAAVPACEFDDVPPLSDAKGLAYTPAVEAGGGATRSPHAAADTVCSAPEALAEVPPVPSVAPVSSMEENQTSSNSDESTDRDDTRAIVPKPAARSSCPEHMLEVQGAYCEDVMHRCIKGGRSHTGDDADEPEPFYCDVYQSGYAKCFGKEDPKHFCIDEFEYPNQKGALPMVMVSWYEAQRLCGLEDKRLCGDDEWTLACEGPERAPYPYGFVRDRTACNIDRLWLSPNDGLLANKAAPKAEIDAEVDRLSKRVPSGSMPRCRSSYGVMDMTGNVDEWAVNVTLDGKPYRSVFKGGHWVSGARNRCRPVTTSHDETTAYYAEGFRCCADLRLASAP